MFQYSSKRVRLKGNKSKFSVREIMMPEMTNICTNFKLKYGQKTWTKLLRYNKKVWAVFSFLQRKRNHVPHKRNMIWSLEEYQIVLNLY